MIQKNMIKYELKEVVSQRDDYGQPIKTLKDAGTVQACIYQSKSEVMDDVITHSVIHYNGIAKKQGIKKGHVLTRLNKSLEVLNVYDVGRYDKLELREVLGDVR